jgi:nucleotide-binding universal stress UspA family protein
LMLYSELPLMIVNPFWQADAEQTGILFPTDFSNESLAAYELVIDLAQKLKQAITVFHKVPLLLTPVYEFSAYPMYGEVYQTQIDYAKSEGKHLVEEAWKHGVSARVEIDTNPAGSPSTAILNYSDKMKCLVAMAARSGPVSAALLGSTTREVVRGSRFPVWVVHPSKNEAQIASTGTELG